MDERVAARGLSVHAAVHANVELVGLGADHRFGVDLEHHLRGVVASGEEQEREQGSLHGSSTSVMTTLPSLPAAGWPGPCAAATIPTIAAATRVPPSTLSRIQRPQSSAF